MAATFVDPGPVRPPVSTDLLRMRKSYQQSRTTLMNDAQDDDVEALRVQRLNDYLRSMLAKADPTAACVGAINTGLIDTAFRFAVAIQHALDNAPPTIESMDKFSSHIDRQMKLDRTVERLARFVSRISAQQEFPPKGASGGD